LNFLEIIPLQTSGSPTFEIIVAIGVLVGILVGIKKLHVFDKKQEEEKSSPLQRLKERYADGKISDEDFDRMKKKLMEE